MVRHGILRAQACPVVSNGCIDKLLGDVVVVPGVWTTFVLGELLCLDNGCLGTIFFDGFPSPLGTNIVPISSEVLLLIDGVMGSPVRGVCHRTCRARMFNPPILLVLDSLLFRRKFMCVLSCVFTVQEKVVSLCLISILLDYNSTVLTSPLGLGILLPTTLGTLLLL